MADTFDTCLAFTLREEGGYVDDPADPGGATNMGITLATYQEWSDPNLAEIQVNDLTLRTARAIYRSLYWSPLRADALAYREGRRPSRVGVSYDEAIEGAWCSTTRAGVISRHVALWPLRPQAARRL